MCELHIYFSAADRAKSYIGVAAVGVDTGWACRHARNSARSRLSRRPAGMAQGEVR